MNETYKKWIEEKYPKVYCQCGCGEEIIVKEFHKQYGIPKYINGHSSYKGKYHETYKEWLNNNCPKVICGCGCGGEIIIKWWHKYNGIPKYIFNHYPKEIREKQSKAMKGKHSSPSTEFKKGQIPWNKGKINIYDEDTIEKMSKAKEGNIPWNKGIPCNEKTKEKISNANDGKIPWIKGKHHTKLAIEKMSKSHKGKIPSWKSGYGKGCYYDSPLQGKIWLRSSWEVKFAEYLDKNEILWLYEIQTFDLGYITYTPDFYLPTSNMFVEVKGYMTNIAQEKINKFLDNYNEETLKILYKEDLIKLGVL